MDRAELALERRGRRPKASIDRFQFQADDGQPLADIVVEVARDPPAFLVLHGQEFPRQRAQFFPAPLEFDATGFQLGLCGLALGHVHPESGEATIAGDAFPGEDGRIQKPAIGLVRREPPVFDRACAVKGKLEELGQHALPVVGMEPGYPEPGVQGECLGCEAGDARRILADPRTVKPFAERGGVEHHGQRSQDQILMLVGSGDHVMAPGESIERSGASRVRVHGTPRAVLTQVPVGTVSIETEQTSGETERLMGWVDRYGESGVNDA